jgi:ABC-2 type transport system ATP-binding protein
LRLRSVKAVDPVDVEEEKTVIATHGLSKRYREVLAVDGLNLTVRRGEIYGFLGRNGAGKTTTIRMILGLISPTTGEVTIFGKSIHRERAEIFGRVGYLVETASAYPNLTVRENLRIHASLLGAPYGAVDEAIELLGLTPYVHRRAGRLSLGNKQRLSLARALLHSPELLILDEPANGLDPAGIVEVRTLLKKLVRERGVTVFMSSHILAEVAHLADRVGIVHEGRLVEELDYEELREESRVFLEVGVSDSQAAEKALAGLGLTGVSRHDGGVLRVADKAVKAEEVARVLVEAGVGLSRLVPVEEDLEARFMRLTGEGEER